MFGFNFDKRTLYIILIILVLYIFMRSGTDFLLTTCLTLPGVIIAITFHEFAHAYAADRLGDTTPRYQGRLTLDPRSHIDPFGIILLIFAHIGWGKPVQINPRNFNSNKSIEKCEAIVSFAGPLTNFILAIFFTIIYYAINIFARSFIYTNIGSIVTTMIYGTIVVNIGLGVFNLIPFPPLDGEKIFRLIMPNKMKNWIDDNMQTIYLIFIVLWITGLLSYVVSPVIDGVYNGIFYLIGKIFSLFI
ncbi:MAG: site-2 protease family protein [Candidatus Scatovivens sp.]